MSGGVCGQCRTSAVPLLDLSGQHVYQDLGESSRCHIRVSRHRLRPLGRFIPVLTSSAPLC
jgi:hypothetical protein